MTRTSKLLSLAVAATLAACGGSKGGGSTGGTTVTSTPNSMTGIVTDVGTGGRLGGATVSGGGQSTTSAADGSFQLANLPAGAVHLSVVKSGYAPGYTNGQSSATSGDGLIVKLKKTGSGTAYDPATAKIFTTTTEAGPYRLAMGANTLDTTGTTGPYTVTVTPLDPTKEADALPGNLDASGVGTAVLLPVTFAEFSILDSTGKRLNLKSSASATVELPIPATLRATYPLGSKIHCYAYSPTGGTWNDFVDGTVVKSTEDGVTPVLQAALRHFSWYGGAPQGNKCVDTYVSVVSAVDGKPLPNARVEATPGTVGYTDAKGEAVVRTTTDGPPTVYTAYRTYIDTDGSVSGMKGAKVIEFGRVEDDGLAGLTGSVPCTSAPSGSLAPRAMAAIRTGTTIKLGVVKDLVYDAQAILMTGEIIVTLRQGVPAPDGTIESGSQIDTTGAKIMLTPAGGSPIAVTELGGGSYMTASPAIVAGKAYTLAIDADGNGSVDALSTIVAVGDLAITHPADKSTVTAAALAGTSTAGWATLTDSATATATAGYSPFYWVTASPVDGALQSLAFYMGTDRIFPLYNLYGTTATAPLLPGDYTASATAFSGFAAGASGFTMSNNIVGANVTGQFFSFSSGGSITFTVQ